MTKSAPLLELHIGFSWRALLLYALVFLIALIPLAQLQWWWVQVLGFVLLCIWMKQVLGQQVFRSHAKSVQALRFQGGEWAWLIGQKWHAVSISYRYVDRNLLLLHGRNEAGKKLTNYCFADSLNAESFRRLRVAMKLAEAGI